jgi:hypothetical protein
MDTENLAGEIGKNLQQVARRKSSSIQLRLYCKISDMEKFSNWFGYTLGREKHNPSIEVLFHDGTQTYIICVWNPKLHMWNRLEDGTEDDVVRL